MKHYKNFKVAFTAANYDFTQWSVVLKHATLKINRAASRIEISIYQEYQSPIMWSSKLATEKKIKEYKPTETLDGFDVVQFSYEYDED